MPLFPDPIPHNSWSIYMPLPLLHTPLLSLATLLHFLHTYHSHLTSIDLKKSLVVLLFISKLKCQVHVMCLFLFILEDRYVLFFFFWYGFFKNKFENHILNEWNKRVDIVKSMGYLSEKKKSYSWFFEESQN